MKRRTRPRFLRAIAVSSVTVSGLKQEVHGGLTGLAASGTGVEREGQSPHHRQMYPRYLKFRFSEQDLEEKSFLLRE